MPTRKSTTNCARRSWLWSARGRQGKPLGYWVRRSSRFCGTTIRHGDWRRDRVLRLFLRERARFSDDPVHERVLCPEPHGELAGWLMHDSVDSMPDALEKAERYARLGASPPARARPWRPRLGTRPRRLGFRARIPPSAGLSRWAARPVDRGPQRLGHVSALPPGRHAGRRRTPGPGAADDRVRSIARSSGGAATRGPGKCVPKLPNCHVSIRDAAGAH